MVWLSVHHQGSRSRCVPSKTRTTIKFTGYKKFHWWGRCATKCTEKHGQIFVKRSTHALGQYAFLLFINT